jgi:N-acetylmuramoyl-L-alanine amidase
MKNKIKKYFFAVAITLISVFAIPVCTQAKEVHIVLDAGHGGKQSGEEIDDNGKTVSEKTINLKIALALRDKLLSYQDVTISMTRETDCTMELEDRFQVAVDEQADLFVSLHNNATGVNFDYDDGCTVLVSKGQYLPSLAEEEQKLGCNILYELTNLGITDRGLLLRTSEVGEVYPNGELADYYALVRAGVNHNIPGIIIEHAFLDDEEDYQQYLSNDEAIEQLAEADARGIARYYGLKKKESGEILSPLENWEEELLWVKDQDPEHNESTRKIFYESENETSSETASTTEKNKKGETTLICPNCKSEVKDGSKFCTKCGTRLSQKSQESQTGAGTGNGPIQKPVQEKKEGNGILIAIIVILVLLIIGMAVLFVLYGSSTKSKTSDSENMADSAEQITISDQPSAEDGDEIKIEQQNTSDSTVTETPKTSTAATESISSKISASAENRDVEADEDDAVLYFILYSDSQYFTEDDLKNFDADMCRYARNGIYARLGRKFADDSLTEYFSAFDWYHPTIEPEDFSESLLNKYQQANRDLIVNYEKEHGF